MRRDWRLKAALQKVLSTVPYGQQINYRLQRQMGGLPISDATLERTAHLAASHLDRLSPMLSKPIAEASFFEFGAGWDLHVPLILRSLGVRHQTTVDIRRLLRPELVADVAQRLHGLSEIAAHWDPPSPPDGSAKEVDGWLRDHGIDYRAPADARATGLATGSIDAATSSNTLEHIPPEDIVRIGREVVRLLWPDGVASFHVDYSDHYCHFDPTISPWNFLGITERRWKWLNSDLHYQNRLRHSSYRDLLERAGFTIVSEELIRPEDPDAARATIRSLPPAPPFDKCDSEDLVVLGAKFLLRANARTDKRA
jgi:hypothetical protein